MTRFTSRALRVCAPLLGVLMVSGVASAKVVTETWQVQGVHGAADEGKIRDALTKLPSIEHPVVSMSTVRVTFDDQKLTEPALQEAVAKAGPFKLMHKAPAAEHAAAAKAHKP